MKRFLLTVAMLAVAVTLHAQATFPGIGSLESDGVTTMNRYSLGYMFRVALPSLPSRGISFTPGITYNSIVWQLNGTVWSPVTDEAGNPTWGWNRVTPPDAGRPLFTTRRFRCVANDGSNEWSYEYSNFHTTNVFFDVDVMLAEDDLDYPECGDGSATTGYGHDSAGKPNGYFLRLDGTGGPNATPGAGLPYPPNYNNTLPKIFAPSGVTVDASGIMHDTNGNSYSMSVSGSTTTYTDSIGRTALVVTDSTSPHQTTYSYYDASHTLQTATMSLTSMSVYSSMGCPGVSDYSTSVVYFPTTFTLADGSSYVFSYEMSTVSGHTSATTGRLAQVTLPTGGYIAYSYGGFNCADGTPTSITKTVNDLASSQVWTYTRTSSGGLWTTKETTPAGNDEQIAFDSDGLPTADKVYQASVGGTVLQETDSTYDSNGWASSTVIVGAKSALTVSGHDVRGNLIDLKEYDWNSSSSILRETLITYFEPSAYLDANLVSLPRYKRIVYGAAAISHTEYFYDGLNGDGSTDTSAIGMVGATGAAGHDDTNYSASSTTPRGNLTRSVQYISPGTLTGPLTTLYGYDSLGNIRETMDPKGNDTRVSYTDSWDGSGCSIGSGAGGAQAYPTSVTQAYGSGSSLTTTLTYSKCIGQVATSTDANSATTSYQYADALLRLTKTFYPDNATTTASIAYGYTHYVASPATTASVATTTLGPGTSGTITTTQTATFDGLGRTKKIVAATGAEVDYLYGFDATNHYVSQAVSNPYSGGSPVYTYSYSDPIGRSVKTLLADGTSASTASHSDNCTVATDPAGANRKLCMDSLGRLADVYEDPNGISGSTPLNYHTQYLYSGLDQVTGVCQGGTFSSGTCSSIQSARTFSYDGVGRLTSETTPEAGSKAYYYTTSAGALCSGDITQVCRVTDGASTTKTYTYDVFNRLTGKSYTGGTSSVAYLYDQSSYNSLTIANGKGRRTGMSDASGSTAWSYDPVGRVAALKKTINSVTKEADYTYSYDGSPLTTTDFGGTSFTYGYNGYSQLSSIGDGTNTYASGATYQPSGAISSLTHQLTSGSTSYTRTFTTNVLQEPSEIKAYPTASSTSPFLKLTYGYGAAGTNNGNIASITDSASGHSNRSQAFTYDPLNRLHTAEIGSSSWGTQYTYDQFGNILGEAGISGFTSGATLTETIPSNDNRVSSGTPDSVGNMTGVHGGAVGYSYDAEGLILTASNPSTVSYVYDGDGNRVKKVGASTTLYWPGATGQIVDESNSGGTSFGRQVWFGGLLVWNEDTSGSSSGRFLFQDQLGSTRVTMNALGTIKDDIDYEPFGTKLANYGSSATNNHYNFTSYETDDDQSKYAVFRNLDSIGGRFNRPDPYLGSYVLANPQSMNRYAYVLNNPLKFVDPIGLNLEERCDYVSGVETGSDGTEHTWGHDSNCQMYWVDGGGYGGPGFSGADYGAGYSSPETASRNNCTSMPRSVGLDISKLRGVFYSTNQQLEDKGRLLTGSFLGWFNDAYQYVRNVPSLRGGLKNYNAKCNALVCSGQADLLNDNLIVGRAMKTLNLTNSWSFETVYRSVLPSGNDEFGWPPHNWNRARYNSGGCSVTVTMDEFRFSFEVE